MSCVRVSVARGAMPPHGPAFGRLVAMSTGQYALRAHRVVTAGVAVLLSMSAGVHIAVGVVQGVLREGVIGDSGSLNLPSLAVAERTPSCMLVVGAWKKSSRSIPSSFPPLAVDWLHRAEQGYSWALAVPWK